MTDISSAPDDEELFLRDKLQCARHAMALIGKEEAVLKTRKSVAEKIAADCERAVIDYMIASGLEATENFILKTSYSIDAPDLSAVPVDFIRFKSYHELNKAAIKAMKPVGNWYTLTPSQSITVKEISA